jgi:glycosyltransferase involved in cell wall biosynthesis
MRRILIFSLAYYPQVGGAEIAIKEITDRISDIEFHMITQRFNASDAEIEQIGSVTVHRVGSGASYLSKILYIPRAAFLARKINVEKKFDAVWAMMAYMLFPIVIMRGLGTNLPYVLTLQEGDPFQHVFKRWYIAALRPMLENGFRNARVVQAISQYLAGWAQGMGYNKQVVVVPNGVDVEHFTTPVSPEELHATRMALGKQDGDVFLITTSRLVHKNAVDDIIRALQTLPENIKLVILGTGGLDAELHSLAQELYVENRVQFVGYIGHKDLPRHLAVSDIFVRPSRSEGMGNSFIEAMAAGLPVIATQEGGIADFLFDAKRNPGKLATGWADDVDSPNQIAQAVTDILANPTIAGRVVAHAREVAQLHYDWGLVADRMRQEVFAPILQP